MSSRARFQDEIDARSIEGVPLQIYRVQVGAPVVIVMPAMGTRADYYRPLVQALCAAGLNSILAELRGTGASLPRPSRRVDFGYRHMIRRDWGAIVTSAKQHFPGSGLVLFGHSLGGQLSCLHQALARPDEQVDAIVLCAACSVFWRAYGVRRGLLTLLGTQSAALVAATLGAFPGQRVGFGGLQPRTVMRDWARQSRTGRYELTGDGADYEAALARLHKPVLAISIAGDRLAPAAAVDHLCGKLTSARVTRWQLDASELALSRIDHFRWVRGSPMLAPRIAAWLRSNLPSIHS